MKVQYISEVLNKTFDNEKDLHRAETEYYVKQKEAEKAAAEKAAAAEKQASERKAEAKKVEDAYKAMIDANKAYRTALGAFLKKYPSYHMSISNVEDSLGDLFESVFKLF